MRGKGRTRGGVALAVIGLIVALVASASGGTAPGAAEAVTVTGDGEAFHGRARADISRVLAVLVDGTEQELALEAHAFSFRATSPEGSARQLRAYAGDALLATVSLPVRCGGPAGPCPAAPSANAADPARALQGEGDPFARVSNRGTRVEPRAEKPGKREMTPRDLFLLRRGEGRAVYRIGGLRPGFNTCYASGPADNVGSLGLISCGKSRFPSRALPLYELSSASVGLRERAPQLVSLAGVAADGVAEVALLDRDGDVVARVPVEANVYLLASPPVEATGALVAYDRNGVAVYRNDRSRQAPPPPATPGRLAGFRVKLTLPREWRGEIRRSDAGPARALVLAGNRLPARDPRSVMLALEERDPRTRPSLPAVATAPQMTRGDVRGAGRYGRAVRRFTLNGRQFTLQVGFGTLRPTAATLAEVNRVLRSLEVGAIAVAAAVPRGTALQRGHADGVTVEVFRSGTVVFRLAPSSRARRLAGDNVGFACFTFDSLSPWEPNEWWAHKLAAATVQITLNEATRPRPPWATLDPVTEPRPPFDGCQVSGSYGRRWNDPRGQRAPAEIGFTAAGRRFFDERAVARDLALFVRTPAMRAVRADLRRGAVPTAAAIARRFAVRVVARASHDAYAPPGTIAVSVSGDVIRVTQRSRGGRPLFVRLRAGRIAQHNLHGLAFVF